MLTSRIGRCIISRLTVGREATSVQLSVHERTALESWVRSGTTQQRHVLRARIVLMADDGLTNVAMAEELDTRPTTAGKWRSRFVVLEER